MSPEKTITTSDISSVWAIIVSIFVAIFSLGVFKSKIATKAELSADIDSVRADLCKESKEIRTLHSKSLYREDGTTIFMPRGECERGQATCAARIGKALDEIKADMQNRHAEYKEHERAHLLQHTDISLILGAMKQFMEAEYKEKFDA